jgi:uncharacterized membrane protein
LTFTQHGAFLLGNAIAAAGACKRADNACSKRGRLWRQTPASFPTQVISKGVVMPEQIEQPPQAPQAPSTGLTESATCGLAYLTFIPGIIFLVTAPYNQNPKVRFHSWQSIFLGITWAALWVISMVLAVVPIIGWLIGLLLFLGLVALWLIVMINAFMGKTIKLPVLGGLAAKQAGYQG